MKYSDYSDTIISKNSWEKNKEENIRVVPVLPLILSTVQAIPTGTTQLNNIMFTQ